MPDQQIHTSGSETMICRAAEMVRRSKRLPLFNIWKRRQLKRGGWQPFELNETSWNSNLPCYLQRDNKGTCMHMDAHNILQDITLFVQPNLSNVRWASANVASFYDVCQFSQICQFPLHHNNFCRNSAQRFGFESSKSPAKSEEHGEGRARRGRRAGAPRRPRKRRRLI